MRSGMFHSNRLWPLDLAVENRFRSGRPHGAAYASGQPDPPPPLPDGNDPVLPPPLGEPPGPIPVPGPSTPPPMQLSRLAG